MVSTRVDINPDLLVWARESAGYSQEQTAKKLGSMKAERYARFEDPSDELMPTIKQLRKIAKVFRRPVSVFYLTKPPEGFQVMRDFRRLPGEGLKFYSPALLYEMERAQQRRELALELFSGIGEEITPFTLTASLEENPETLAARIRAALGVTFDEQMSWRRQDALGPLRAWRRAIEGLNVLVFQIHGVDRNEVSGFAVAERLLPVIAVNRSDTPNRRTFSLLHEFVHILLQLSGASELDVDAARPPEEQAVEVFCNRTAAATLIPQTQLLGSPLVESRGQRNENWTDDNIRELADSFGVSREALLRRLLVFGRTTQRFYSLKRDQYTEEFLRDAERRRTAWREGSEEFRRNPPQDAFVELGRPFVRLILDSVRQDLITLNEASGYLGNLRIRHFPKLEQRTYTT
jgi:Zn-dependent peptidase ImmA (M78 family)/DNA-binding XRE family transcriptional regulator